MIDLSSKERLVLFALQAYDSGLTHAQLTVVTSLGWQEIERCIQRLENLHRAYHIAEGPYTYYVAPSFPDQALLPKWNEWLACFSEAHPQFEDRDRLATMYDCCGVVLLTALVGGTTDPELISRVTTLPLEFVCFVLSLADRRYIWDLESVFRLRHHLCSERVDLTTVEKLLQRVKENLWELCWTPTVEARLHELRQCRQFGGNVDSWTDAEDVDGVDRSLE